MLSARFFDSNGRRSEFFLGQKFSALGRQGKDGSDPAFGLKSSLGRLQSQGAHKMNVAVYTYTCLLFVNVREGIKVCVIHFYCI